MGNAVPFGNFDLSDMDLSLTSLCEGSNNLQELLMDNFLHSLVTAAVLAVPVVAAAASVVAFVLAVVVASVAVAVVLELVEVAVVSAVAVAVAEV